MAELNNNEKVAAIVSMIGEKAGAIAHRAFNDYSAANGNTLIDEEVKKLVSQRAHSELMLRMCAFKPAEHTDADGLRESFDAWFASEEEARLNQMCASMIAEEVKKHTAVGEENLSFSERYKKKVKERQSNAVTLNRMINE